MDEILKRIFINTRTHYKFLDKEVRDETLKELHNLVKWSATSFNSSPLRLRFLKSSQSKERIKPHLIDSNVESTMKAPVCTIIAMDLNFWKDLHKNYLREDAKIYFENNEKKINETAFRNSTLQGGYFLKAANALGLATGPMSGFFNKGVDEEFFKDTSIRSNFLCNIGYGDPTGTYDRAYRYKFDEVSEIL